MQYLAYNVGSMNIVYDMGYAATALLTSPVWGYRLLKTGKWRTDWLGRFGRCAPCNGHQKDHSTLAEEGVPDQADTPAPAKEPLTTLLIHSVSVGEVNAVAKLVGVLDRRGGGRLRIVISATTDTGIARARQLFEPTHQVVRFPLDFGRCVRRFLNTVKPDLVALTELEVWPNFVEACSRRNVPVCVINGRLSARSYRRYRLIAALLQPTFAKLAAVAAQSPEYADRFAALGVPEDRIRVLDSMKWDNADNDLSPTDDPLTAGARKLADAMGIDTRRPVIVAGSTGPGEERILIDHGCRDAQLILAPRKPERFDAVAALDPNIVRRSRYPDGNSHPKRYSRLFLLDTLGELRKAYALADVAIVGRSFLGGQHGSNPLEPVALGKPTLIGPHHEDFADVVAALHAEGGIIITECPSQLASQLLTNPQRARDLAQRGRRVMQARQGTTDKHADMLLNLLPAAVDAPPTHARV